MEGGEYSDNFLELQSEVRKGRLDVQKRLSKVETDLAKLMRNGIAGVDMSGSGMDQSQSQSSKIRVFEDRLRELESSKMMIELTQNNFEERIRNLAFIVSNIINLFYNQSDAHEMKISTIIDQIQGDEQSNVTSLSVSRSRKRDPTLSMTTDDMVQRQMDEESKKSGNNIFLGGGSKNIMLQFKDLFDKFVALQFKLDEIDKQYPEQLNQIQNQLSTKLDRVDLDILESKIVKMS